MKKKLQIFVSSTYIDLKEERQAAVEAILKSGNIPAGMELFAAGDKSQLETITRWIDESDVYFLILGGRYGSIESTTGNSYTEIEYDYAKSINKPTFAVVIKEDYLNKKVQENSIDFIEREHNDKLKQFRDKVLKNTSSFFSSTSDIKLAIHETLADFKDRYDFSGWVPGIIETEIDELKKENSLLKKEIEELKKYSAYDSKKSNKELKDTMKNDNEEFQNIYNYFESKIVKFKSNDKIYEFNINKFILTYYETMITGIYNQYNMSEIDSILFFSVMPQLNLFDLAEIEPVPRVAYRRFFLTSKGKKYSIYLNKKTESKGGK